MGDGCGCGPSGFTPPRPPSRPPPVPRMGVRSFGPLPPMHVDRSLPLACPIPPRPRSPPRMPKTVPEARRSRHRPKSPKSSESCLDKTLSPGPGDRTLTGSIVRSPDFTKFGSTMEELSKLEFVEMQNVEDDLRKFHLKRRKLVFNIASINLSKAKKSIKKAVSKMGLK